MANDFLTALSDHPLVCDGAMGTMLYAKGFRMTRCFDELNLTHPDQVSELHDAYVDAGADMIETNTYGASRLKLTPHGLGDSVLDINRRGVELARKAADRVARYRKVFVAGSVGPRAVRCRSASTSAWTRSATASPSRSKRSSRRVSRSL